MNHLCTNENKPHITVYITPPLCPTLFLGLHPHPARHPPHCGGLPQGGRRHQGAGHHLQRVPHCTAVRCCSCESIGRQSWGDDCETDQDGDVNSTCTFAQSRAVNPFMCTGLDGLMISESWYAIAVWARTVLSLILDMYPGMHAFRIAS